jgi:hypothetical protein
MNTINCHAMTNSASVMRSNSENVPHRRVPAVVGLICLALFCASTVFLEFKMLLLFGATFIVFAAASALAVILGALYRAPEGDERAGGLHAQSSASDHWPVTRNFRLR